MSYFAFRCLRPLAGVPVTMPARRQCFVLASAGAIWCSLRLPRPQIAYPIFFCDAARRRARNAGADERCGHGRSGRRQEPTTGLLGHGRSSGWARERYPAPWPCGHWVLWMQAVGAVAAAIGPTAEWCRNPSMPAALAQNQAVPWRAGSMRLSGSCGSRRLPLQPA